MVSKEYLITLRPQLRWKDQPETLMTFLTKFLSMSTEENHEETLKELILMASSESDLVERLEKLHEEMYRELE